MNSAEVILDHLAEIIRERDLADKLVQEATAKLASLERLQQEIYELSAVIQEEVPCDKDTRVLPAATQLLKTWRDEIVRLRAELRRTPFAPETRHHRELEHAGVTIH